MRATKRQPVELIERHTPSGVFRAKHVTNRYYEIHRPDGSFTTVRQRGFNAAQAALDATIAALVMPVA